MKGITLKGEDAVVGVGVIDPADEKVQLLVLTENGYGKKTKISEYKVQGRGGSGIKTINITTKTGKLIGAKVVSDETEIMAMSQKSQVIRTTIKSVSTLGRATQGVRIMKLRTGDSVASFTLM